MLYEFDIDVLIKHKINAHQFLILQLLLDRRIESLTFYSQLGDLKQDLTILYEKDFINKQSENLNDIYVTQKFKDIIINGDLFTALLLEYPSVVLRPDGTLDSLKTDLISCRLMYQRITLKNKVKHDHIIKCLKYEVEQRRSTNTLCYMRRLPKWLSCESWKAYEDKVDNDAFSVRALEDRDGYGNEIE